MKDRQHLAIIDWGIGGISIYRLIKSRLSNVPITYLSDTGVTPYGKMSRTGLVSRLTAVVSFLRSRGVTHLVVGCNSASTAVGLLDNGPIKIEGMIQSAVRAVESHRPVRLALIGGRRTVLSHLYRRALAARGIEVTQRIAQPLSGLIEGGDVGSPELRAHCRRILSPIRHCSHLLLACTHYPAIAGILRESLGANTVLIDPAEELVKRVGRWGLSGGGTDTMLTTGDAQKMKVAARNAFGVDLEDVRQVFI